MPTEPEADPEFMIGEVKPHPILYDWILPSPQRAGDE